MTLLEPKLGPIVLSPKPRPSSSIVALIVSLLIAALWVSQYECLMVHDGQYYLERIELLSLATTFLSVIESVDL